MKRREPGRATNAPDNQKNGLEGRPAKQESRTPPGRWERATGREPERNAGIPIGRTP